MLETARTTKTNPFMVSNVCNDKLIVISPNSMKTRESYPVLLNFVDMFLFNLLKSY